MDVNKPSKKKRKYKNVTSKNSIKQYLKQKQNIGSRVQKNNRRRYSTSDSSDIVDTDVKRKTTETRKEYSKSNERRKKIPVPKWKSTPKASHTPHQQKGHSPYLEDVMEEISSISNASLPYSVHSNVTQVSTTSTAGTVSESSGSESRSIEQVRPSVTVKTKARRRKKSGFLMHGYNKSKSKAGSPRSSKKQSPKWKSTPKVRHTPLGPKDNDEIDGLSAIGMDMHTRFVNSRTMGENTIRGASSSSQGRVSPSTITTSPIRAKRRKLSEVLKHLSEQKQKGLTKSQNHSVNNERSGNAKDNGRSITHQEPGSINHEQGSVSAEISNITNSIQQQLNEPSSEEQNSKSLNTRKSTGRKKRKSTLELFRRPKRKSDDVLSTSIRSEKATTPANRNEKATTKNVSKATLPSKQRNASPTKQRNISPAKQKNTSPTEQRKTSPTEQRNASPTKQRNTSPTEQRDTSPAKQRKTSLTKQRNISPTKQRKTIPANNRTRSPIKLSETRPPRTTSPAKHRNASPAKQRNASPAKQRNASHAKQRNASRAKQRNASPAKQRNASPAKQRKISPANQKRSSSNVRPAVVKRDRVRTTKQRTKASREPGPKPKGSNRRSAIQSSHSENDDSDDSDVFTTIRFTDRQRTKWGAVSQKGTDYVNSAVDNIIK